MTCSSRGLAELGFGVIGIDRSPALIAEARARTVEATYVVAGLRAWRPPEPAGAVLCRGVLDDLLEDGDRRAAFAAFAARLRPGGILLADAREWHATRRARDTSAP